MSADNKLLLRNGVLTVVCLAVIVAALLSTSIDEPTRKAVVGSALAYVVGLWTHSGRPRGDGTGGLDGTIVPVVCLAALSFGACEFQGGSLRFGPAAPVIVQSGAVARVQDEYRAQAKLLTDSIEFTAAAAPSFTSGRGGIYLSSVDGLFHTVDTNALDLKMHAAQSFRTSASCAGLSSPANGDVCYDSGLTAFRYYAAGWTTAPTNDALLVHLAGTESITGAKTFTTTPVLPAGALVYARIHGAIAGGLGAATVYLGGIGVAASSTEYPLSLTTKAGTVRNLYCYLGTAPGGADTVVFTVRKGGVDQTTTCTITGAATTCNNTANTFSVVVGDRVSIKAVSSAGTAAGAACSVEQGN